MDGEPRCGYCGRRGGFAPDEARIHFTAACLGVQNAAKATCTVDPAETARQRIEQRARRDARAWVEKIKDDAAIIGHPDRELAWWRQYYERTDIGDEYRAQALDKIVELEAALPAYELAQQLNRRLFGDDLDSPPIPSAPSAVQQAAETTHVVLVALSAVFGVGALLGFVLILLATWQVNLPLLTMWLACGVVFAWSRGRIATRHAAVRRSSA